MVGGGHALGTAARSPVHRKKDGFPRRSAPRNDRKRLSLRGGPQGRRGNPHPPSPKAPLCKGGRLRAPPVTEEASKKEWQRSKFCERMRAKNFGHRNRSCHGFAVTEGLSEVAGPFWGWSLLRFQPTPRDRAANAPLCAAGQGNRGGSPQPPVGHDDPGVPPSRPPAGRRGRCLLHRPAAAHHQRCFRRAG